MKRNLLPLVLLALSLSACATTPATTDPVPCAAPSVNYASATEAFAQVSPHLSARTAGVAILDSRRLIEEQLPTLFGAFKPGTEDARALAADVRDVFKKRTGTDLLGADVVVVAGGDEGFLTWFGGASLESGATSTQASGRSLVHLEEYDAYAFEVVEPKGVVVVPNKESVALWQDTSAGFETSDAGKAMTELLAAVGDGDLVFAGIPSQSALGALSKDVATARFAMRINNNKIIFRYEDEASKLDRLEGEATGLLQGAINEAIAGLEAMEQESASAQIGVVYLKYIVRQVGKELEPHRQPGSLSLEVRTDFVTHPAVILGATAAGVYSVASSFGQAFDSALGGDDVGPDMEKDPMKGLEMHALAAELGPGLQGKCVVKGKRAANRLGYVDATCDGLKLDDATNAVQDALERVAVSPSESVFSQYRTAYVRVAGKDGVSFVGDDALILPASQKKLSIDVERSKKRIQKSGYKLIYSSPIRPNSPVSIDFEDKKKNMYTLTVLQGSGDAEVDVSGMLLPGATVRYQAANYAALHARHLDTKASEKLLYKLLR